MPRFHPLIAVVLLGAAVAPAWADEPDWSSMPYAPHSAYQAVDEYGNGTFPLTSPVKMKGIILHRSEEMLDSSCGAPAFLGGQWQVYVQAADPNDFGGTACYMAELYGKLPWIPPDQSYTPAEWLYELNRVRTDPATGHLFRPGDLVEIQAKAPGLFYGGKTNVNETHSIDPDNDLRFVLLAADCGLPEPTVITLSDVKDEADQYRFDWTRQTGCERYQATLVRINNVQFVNPGAWAPNATLTIQDSTGRTFPLKLGLGSGFTQYSAPVGPFDVVALFDQEDTNNDGDGMEGYRLWLTQNYDGNGVILPRAPTMPGDMDGDGDVDMDDVPLFVEALADRDGFEAAHPQYDALAANCDGICGIDGLDVAAFLNLLLLP